MASTPMFADSIMHVLKAHQERITRLRASLDKLFSMHGEHLSTWDKIVAIVKEKGVNDPPEVKEPFDRTQELAREITQLRRDTFGVLSHTSELNIASKVESSLGDANTESVTDTGAAIPEEGPTQESTAVESTIEESATVESTAVESATEGSTAVESLTAESITGEQEEAGEGDAVQEPTAPK